MSCPTCSHTMHALDAPEWNQTYHCPRCGTLLVVTLADGRRVAHVPKLVERCRRYEEQVVRRWHQSGIQEAINPPEDRPNGPTV